MIAIMRFLDISFLHPMIFESNARDCCSLDSPTPLLAADQHFSDSRPRRTEIANTKPLVSDPHA